MTDEHLMRLWADAHDGFSADLDRGILKLDIFLRGRSQATPSIGKTYAPVLRAAAPDESMSTTARAALAGAVACVATTVLLLTVALLATADLQPAAAYPIMTHTIVA